MSKDLTEAKKMFLKYGGSHYEMERSGEYTKYLEFSVTDDQEAEWGKERRTSLVATLNDQPVAGTDFQELVGLIKACHDYEGLRLLIDSIRHMMSTLDTFTLVRFAEELCGLTSGAQPTNRHDTELCEDLKRLIVGLVDAASTSTFNVAPYYEQIPYLRGVLTEDRITRRIESLRARLGS